MERASPEKHEYFQGEIFAMAGASLAHNRLVANIIGALDQALGERCTVFPSDLRIHVPATGLYTYADVGVVCEEPQLADSHHDILLNPLVLIDVLSESTENYDRGKKFESYRSIASLTDYVLVAQDRVLIEHYQRQPDGAWLLREIRSGALRLPCGEIAVEQIYRRLRAAAQE